MLTLNPNSVLLMTLIKTVHLLISFQWNTFFPCHPVNVDEWNLKVASQVFASSLF